MFEKQEDLWGKGSSDSINQGNEMWGASYYDSSPSPELVHVPGESIEELRAQFNHDYKLDKATTNCILIGFLLPFTSFLLLPLQLIEPIKKNHRGHHVHCNMRWFRSCVRFYRSRCCF